MIADSNFHNSNSGKSEGNGSRGAQQLITTKPAAANSSEAGQTLPLQALLSAVRRRWMLAVPLGLCLAAAGATAAWVVFAPEYTASAYLRVASNERTLLFGTADQNRGDFKLYKNTQQQLMKASYVLNRAMDEELAALPVLQKEADPLSWLQEQVSVDFPGDGEIMRVSLTTSSRNASVEMVNAIVDAYKVEVVDNERRERQDRRDELERAQAIQEDKVRNKRGQLKMLAATLGTSDFDSLSVVQQSALQQFGLMQEKLATIQFELMQAEGELQIAQDIDRQFKTQLAEAEKMAEAEKAAEGMGVTPVRKRSPELLRLEEEVTTLRMRLGVRGIEGVGHPSYVRLQQELALREKLLKDRQAEENEIADQIEDQIVELERLTSPTKSLPTGRTPYDVVELSMRCEILRNQEKILQAKVDELADETRQLGRSSIDVELLRAEIAGLETVLSTVSNEVQRTTIELLAPSRITTQPGAASVSASDPKKRLIKVAAMALAGLFGPLGLLVVWDLSRQKVDNEEAVTRAISFSNLGTIPIVRSGPLLLEDAKIGNRGRGKRAELAESLDSVAAMLLHRAEIEDRQVFMISSAVAGEGKSTVACQLSSSLAGMGKKVVLVDFDLRRSSIHDYLKLQPGPGVSEILQREMAWSEAIQRTAVDNLCVLTAGQRSINLREAANSGAIEAFLIELRSNFDIVIVDSCPILPVADSRVLGKFCDAVILTLVRDISRLPLATKACEILKSYGIRVLGTVVIGCKPGVYSKYYDRSGEKQESPPLANADA